jgi:hypothetical protein
VGQAVNQQQPGGATMDSGRKFKREDRVIISDPEHAMHGKLGTVVSAPSKWRMNVNMDDEIPAGVRVGGWLKNQRDAILAPSQCQPAPMISA